MINNSLGVKNVQVLLWKKMGFVQFAQVVLPRLEMCLLWDVDQVGISTSWRCFLFIIALNVPCVKNIGLSD